MVNASLNWASIVGIVLAVGGALLYFMRTFKPALARDYDVFFAAIGLLCGGILFFQGWRLDPILQFGQFLLAGTTVFFAYESVRLRGVATEQARRSAYFDDEPAPARGDGPGGLRGAGMTATNVLMNPSRCGGVSPAATTTLKSDLKRSSTGRAAPAAPRSLKRQPAVAPWVATQRIPAGNKTVNAPAAWPASGPEKPVMSNAPILDPDDRSGTINAAAAVLRAALNVLPANPPRPALRMPPSVPAAAHH